MQQAATRAEREASSAADSNAPSSALQNAFVINLVSSTTPVALKRPDHGGLKRFTFFVSRRREDSRERFRLHMGYFDTQEEAEKLLDIVREIYPGAWAGLAPGRGLRGTPAVAIAVQPQPAIAPRPLVQPIPPAAAARVTVPASAPSASTPALTPALPSAAAAAAGIGRGDRDAERSPAAPRRDIERQATVRSLGSVREAIAALGEAGAAKPAAARAAPPRVGPPLPVARVIPTCAPVSVAKRAEPPARELNERGVLKVLEGSASAPPRSQSVAPRDERSCFAVQLIWSVQPFDMARVPQLAIFSAYTLYGAQGHRDGRRWYGLRLGFFTDAVSAKQVAQYVRADFTTVSVVPISAREREQAKMAVSSAGPAPMSAATAAPVTANAARSAPRRVPAVSMDEFRFIDEATSDNLETLQKARAVPPQQSAARPTRPAPGKRAVVRAPGRIHAHRKAKAMTLEETLEILGANDLQVEPEGHVLLSEEGTGVPQTGRAGGKGKPSRLSRLFVRLSERLGS